MRNRITFLSIITITLFFAGWASGATVTIESTPISGITISSDVAPGTTPYSKSGLSGSASFTAPETHNGYKFVKWVDGWGDEYTDRHIEIGMFVDWELTAVYEQAPTYILEVNSTPINGIPISASPSSASGNTDYSVDELSGSVSLTAPETHNGYEFVKWVDGWGGEYTNRHIEIGMVANWDLTAIYQQTQPSIELTLYRISSPDGTMNTASPGTAKTVFNPGDTVRITLKADNLGSDANVSTVLNIREPDDSTILYDSNISTTTDSGTVENNNYDSPLTNSEGYDYYSFDKVIPLTAQAGQYDIGGSIRNFDNWEEAYDTTAHGRNDNDWNNAWLGNQFSVDIPNIPLSFETGCVVFRDGVFFGLTWHNGIFWFYDGYANEYRVIQGNGWVDTNPLNGSIPLSDILWAQFLDGNNYRGTRELQIGRAILESDRLEIINEARFQYNADYTFSEAWGIIAPYNHSNSSYQSGDGMFRCDMLVQWVYDEAFGDMFDNYGLAQTPENMFYSTNAATVGISIPAVVSKAHSTDIDTNVTIEFSELMSTGTLDPDFGNSISISGSIHGPYEYNVTFESDAFATPRQDLFVHGLRRHDCHRVIIDPIYDFMPNETITVTVSTTARDLGGNPIQQPYQFEFTTVPSAGSIQINLSPQAAIDAGAQWNLDGGDWQDSGAILQASIGEHTINYKNISHSSWIAPASDEVTISVVGMSLERSYQWDPPEEGMLKVSITPQGAIDAGARWRVDGQVPWYESGQTATVSQGTHTVSFTDVPCWAKPEEFEVYVPAGQLVTENVVYTGVCETPSAVIMSISPSPADPQSDTVQFRENSTDNDEGGNSIEYWKWTSNLGKYDGNFTLYQSNTSGDFDLSANDLQVGTHTITLYVEDNEDDFDSTTETLTVTNVKPVIDSFSVNKGAEDSFIFTGTAHDRDENQQSITGWQIGIAGLSYSNTLMAGAGNLNYAFNSSGLAAGAYSVSVVAIDDENAPSDPVTYTIEIGMLSCDINADQNVNYADFSTIASWWMLACSGPDWCGGSDFNRSGYINNDDLLYFAENWLENNSDPSLTLLLNEPLSGLRARTSIVADINHDGQQELVVGALMSDGTPVVKIYSVSGTVLSELWSYSISDAPKDGIVGVCVGDVDNDGVPELAVHTATYRDGQIRIFEKGTGNTWTQVWSEASRSDHSPDDLSIGDCDNDGLNELVVGKSYGNRRVYVYDHSGGDSYARTITPLPGTDYRSVWVGDLKGNGSNVILAGTAFWGSAPVIVAEYNGSSYASIWTMSDSQQNFQETKGGNVDTDGDNEIVVSTSKGWGSKTAVRVYDYAGNNSWSQSWIYQEGNWNFYRAPEVGNLIPWNGCNEFFVAASDSGNNRIYMFDNYGGSYRVAWMESLSGSVNDSCVGDVDNDGKDELVLLSGSSVIVYEY